MKEIPLYFLKFLLVLVALPVGMVFAVLLLIAAFFEDMICAVYRGLVKRNGW